MSQEQGKEPSKLAGQFHSMKGSAAETIGNMTGASSLAQSGKEEHGRGEAQYTAAQAKGYAEGVTDRMGGYKESVVGALAGDKEQQLEGNAKKEKGRMQQEANKT